jgi:hypothetical protein
MNYSKVGKGYNKELSGHLKCSKYNLLPEPRIIINIDFTSIINTFQDLRYIGQLRQRWEEIKKLQGGMVAI